MASACGRRAMRRPRPHRHGTCCSIPLVVEADPVCLRIHPGLRLAVVADAPIQLFPQVPARRWERAACLMSAQRTDEQAMKMEQGG